MEKFTDEQISGQVLDHLGLVASTIDRIGLVDKIDERLPITQGTGSKVSQGQRVSAMILNGLGFIDNRLYMFPNFLENKPVQRLFGEGVEAEHFNDDALGRCLDAIHAYGITPLFSDIAFSIGTKQKLLGYSAHFDTTSLNVHGEYANNEKESTETNTNADNKSSSNARTKDKNTPERVAPPTEISEAPQTANAAQGYSKDHRHDLKQFVLNWATTGASGFPIWFESHSGNASDKKI